MERIFRSLLVLALLLGLSPVTALAAGSGMNATASTIVPSAGDLDPTFGTDGETIIEIIPGEDHWEPKLALQPDDKIIAAGGCGDDEVFCVARLTADGHLDTTFGAPNGYVMTDLTSDTDSPRDVTIQPDGKILVIGECNDSIDFCVARYNTDGSLDTANFGAPDGFVVFSSGSVDEGESIAVTTGGDIIAAGECDFNEFLCVALLDSNGDLDLSFGGLGVGFNLIDPTLSADDEDPEVAIQSDGKIVIVGSCDDRNDVCVARFNTDGSADNATFGGVGNNWTRTPIGGGDNYMQDIRITPSGQILVTGECDDLTYFCLLAYDSSGILDTSFGGGDGIVLTEFVDDWNGAYGMQLQPDGKILLVGGCQPLAHTCLARYETNGDLDTGFGDDGKVIHKFTEFHDVGINVLVQSDGKIVVSAECDDYYAYCFARFYGEDVVDDTIYTGVSGGTYFVDDAWVYIPPGAVPSSPDADIDQCILTIEKVGNAATYGVQLDEYVWEVTVVCDGHRVTRFYPALTICLPPKEGGTVGKQLYSRHDGETEWNPLPLVSVRTGMVCGTTNQLSLFLVGRPDYPLTGFAPGLTTKLPEQPAAAAYAATNMVLEIDKLGLQLDIVGVPQTPTGWDVTWLGSQAGYLFGSAYPTWEGNTVLTAHVWSADNMPGPFYGLKDLEYGDQIEIEAYGQTYTYEVRQVRLLDGDSIPRFEHSDFDMLTLITCESFDERSGEYLYRRMVSAVLISID